MANILEQYQLFQKETSIKNYNLTYLALGLGGEIGEVQNEIKKLAKRHFKQKPRRREELERKDGLNRQTD